MYRSYIKLKIKDKCENCSLDYGKFDIGDAPAYFSIFTIGFLIPILAIIVDEYFSPSLLVHMAIWIPATVFFCYLTLIYIRSLFIYLEYNIKKHDK